MRQRLVIRGLALVVTLAATHGFTIADIRDRPSSFLQSALEPQKIVLDNVHARSSFTSTSTSDDNDRWIQHSIESQIKDEVVVGPDHVLIYDTTLRGMYS